MESLYMLIPLGVLAAAAVLAALWWAVHSGQYEDMEGPAHAILFDRDEEAK